VLGRTLKRKKNHGEKRRKNRKRRMKGTRG
jgi:hypothetical protein